MPETPLPHTLADENDSPPGHGAEWRAKKRASSPHRPVSAFAPAHPKSDPPTGGTLALTPDDCSFVAMLRSAGLASELEGAELARVAKHISGETRQARRLDLLSAYYAAAGDALVSRRRQATDRWFTYTAGESTSVSLLLGRLLSVWPELPGARIERVGGSSGTLVVRAGDHVCALEDELESEDGASTVTVSGLVRALNVLLDRQGVRARLVGLFGDGQREVYLGIGSLAVALPLAHADYLTVLDAEGLMECTGW